MSKTKQNNAPAPAAMPPVDIKAGRAAYIKACKGICKPSAARKKYQIELRKQDKLIRRQLAITAIGSYRERPRKDGKRSIACFGVIG